VSEYNEVFSGYQPRKMVQFCRNQRFEDHINSTTLRMRTEMVFETLVFTKLNHLTRLIAQENFIKSLLFCMDVKLGLSH